MKLRQRLPIAEKNEDARAAMVERLRANALVRNQTCWAKALQDAPYFSELVGNPAWLCPMPSYQYRLASDQGNAFKLGIKFSGEDSRYRT